MKLKGFVVLFLATSVVIGSSVSADTIQLVNGDTLNGTVLSLNGSEIKIESSILGEIAIKRANVVAITFGERKAVQAAAPQIAPARPAAPVQANLTPNDSDTGDAVLKQLKKNGIDPSKITGIVNQFGPAGSVKTKDSSETPNDVLQQLRTDGIDKQMVKDLKTKLPLLNLPGVGTYFDKTLNGLAAGDLDLSHIRKDAIKARDGLIDVKKDLGPHGAALDGYLRILDNFILETEPAKKPEQAKPKNSSKPRESRGKT